tara:strand:+ start:240 stop:422 length:183 start_codon:yes stop_codon:yes gene_type:complete
MKTGQNAPKVSLFHSDGSEQSAFFLRQVLALFHVGSIVQILGGNFVLKLDQSQTVQAELT